MKLEHSDIRNMLEVAIVAARLGGQRAMEEIRYLKSTLKGDEEMVSNADVLCQKLIIERIKENYPDHGFLAEEGGDRPLLKQPPRSEHDIWWVIDPIDGTNNYCHGLLCFGVSIAVVHQGRPIVGVIFDPATERMYTAATEMEAQCDGSRITVSDEKISRLASFGLDSHLRPEQIEPVQEILRRTRFRNLGTTALHLAYVSKGSMVGMLSNDAKLWDLAAGVFLVTTAGGRVEPLDGGELFPIDCAAYEGRPYSVLATNGKTHDEFSKMFRL